MPANPNKEQFTYRTPRYYNSILTGLSTTVSSNSSFFGTFISLIVNNELLNSLTDTILFPKFSFKRTNTPAYNVRVDNLNNIYHQQVSFAICEFHQSLNHWLFQINFGIILKVLGKCCQYYSSSYTLQKSDYLPILYSQRLIGCMLFFIAVCLVAKNNYNPTK